MSLKPPSLWIEPRGRQHRVYWRNARGVVPREALATAAAEHLGHDLIADPRWQAVDLVEERLRAEFPAVWERAYPD